MIAKALEVVSVQDPHKERPIRVGAGVQTPRKALRIWPHDVIEKCPT